VSERRARAARRSGGARSQHFLRSGALAAELVGDAGVQPDELVLDLGAGSGRLTEPLARAARDVVAVELDPRWADGLDGRWPNVEVVRGDAASLELPRERFRVVASLPFDRTTAILRHLLGDPRVPLTGAYVVVEWGVALKRALPWPSTLNDVLWGAWYSIRLERRLPRSVFEPVPAVDAGVLVIQRRLRPLVPEQSWRRYRGFVAAGFRRGPAAVVPTGALRRLGLTRAQARDLDAHQWAALFAATRKPASDRRRCGSPR
jgi:23S rRNA (adenine-N6)-dimethyltransferase